MGQSARNTGSATNSRDLARGSTDEWIARMAYESLQYQ
jgi:hypothetical protein